MIRLEPMDEVAYVRFRARCIANYAEQQVRAGTWHPEDAQRRSEQTVDGLLTEGLATPGHSFCAIVDDARGESVGYLWYGIVGSGDEQHGFVYDLLVYEGNRRRGYGTAALRAMEDVLRARGAGKVVLHVFAHNAEARAAYTKVGYVERNITMVKTIEPRGETERG